MTTYLVHDIETIPETELMAEWAVDKAKQEAKGVKDPFPGIPYHKVLCIGMLMLDEDLHPIKSGCAEGGVAGGKSEKAMIAKWSKLVAGDGGPGTQLHLVDWHGRGFDVPVLQTRAFRYGIPMPWYFDKLPDNRGGISSFSKEYRDRYGGWHEDLADDWTNHGAFPRPHMASLAQLMGLPGKLGMDGGDVYAQWKEYAHAKKVSEGRAPETTPGTPEQYAAWAKKADELARRIDIYCMQDVFQTAFILQRYRFLAGDIDLDRYQEAAQALFDHIAALPEHADFAGRVDLPSLRLES